MSRPTPSQPSAPTSLPPASEPAHEGPVLFFDGECGLCNRVVRGLLRLDRAGQLRFAPLQGPTAQAYLLARGLPTKDFDSIVFVPRWAERERMTPLVRTDGAMAALRATGSRLGRMLAAILKLFPRAVRNTGYRVIGHWRYRIFGPWVPRPLARAEWERRFLA